MIPVEEALERILSRITVLGDERVALLDALDRVLAESVVAERDIPPWPNSSMDGYALRSADTRGAGADRPARLTLAGHVAAGRLAERALGPGETYRIKYWKDGAKRILLEAESVERNVKMITNAVVELR